MKLCQNQYQELIKRTGSFDEINELEGVRKYNQLQVSEMIEPISRKVYNFFRILTINYYRRSLENASKLID